MGGRFFSFTIKPNVRRSKDERIPAKAPDAPRAYHYTPTHARIDSIMGVPPSYSTHDHAAAVKEADEKGRRLSDLNNISFNTPINTSSRNSSYNSLDEIAMGKPAMARKPSNCQLYRKPRQKERRKPSSSPLANVFVPEELKLEEDGESGYESGTKEYRDEKRCHPVTDNSPETRPGPASDTTERKDFAQTSNARMEPSTPHAVHARDDKASIVLISRSTAHALAKAPKVFLSTTPIRDALPVKEWKGDFF